MPPVPPLMTSNVAIDRNGNGWIYEPGGIAHDIGLMPLGSTNPGTTPPSNPQLGWLWWDTAVNELKVWNGTAWMASAGGGSGGIGEPTTAGSWLRTNVGTWVAGLPLTSTVTATVPGVVMTVNDTSWANYGIGITVVDGQGFRLENQGGGEGIYLRNQATATNRLLYLTDVRTAAMTDFLGNVASVFFNRAGATNTNPILHINQGAAPGPAINVNHNTPISGTYAASFRTDRTTMNAAGLLLGNLVFAGRNVAGGTNPGVTGAEIRAVSTAAWSATNAGTRLEFLTAPATAPITPVVRMTIDQDGAVTIPNLQGVTGAATGPVLAVNNSSTNATSVGLTINQTGPGYGIHVIPADGTGIRFDPVTTTASYCIRISTLAAANSTAIGISSSNMTVPAINISTGNLQAPALQITATGFNNAPLLDLNGSTPAGVPIVRIFQNGAGEYMFLGSRPVTLGDPDSGGTGFRALVVPN